MVMSDGRFDSLERQAADNIDAILAEVEKDRDELAMFSGRRPAASQSGCRLEAGAQQIASNATELLNALRQLSRSLKGR